ncbi:MAG: hypothetical protein KKB30_11715, partial [Proteobacteria bacterium]|nr:hypothetical protein [Pseudomonadota bacterium]MBU1715863.1 hypothetical protein [Pseudomonadota bacterium]
MTDLTSEHINPKAHGGPSYGELRAARNFVAAFLNAVRNYSLYPESHVTTQNYLNNVLVHLTHFFKSYGNLRLDIDKVRIIYKGEEIHEGPSNAENPAFFFYRDGIKWLEFQIGSNFSEISAFFRIIKKFQVLLDEPEGDLVTDLWSANLPHLAYEVSDDLWAAEPVLEFSMMGSLASSQLFGGAGWKDGFIFGQQGHLPQPIDDSPSGTPGTKARAGDLGTRSGSIGPGGPGTSTGTGPGGMGSGAGGTGTGTGQMGTGAGGTGTGTGQMGTGAGGTGTGTGQMGTGAGGTGTGTGQMGTGA